MEAEAIPAGVLCQMLGDAIEAFVDQDVLKVLQAAEESEHRLLEGLSGQVDEYLHFLDQGGGS